MRIAGGLALIALSLIGARVFEAVDLLRFPLAWAGVLLALDGLARRRHGSSPLATASDWLATAAASVLFWDLFELVDLRLHDWWYTGTSASPWLRAGFAAASFATVLPAARLFVFVVAPTPPRVVARGGPSRGLLAIGLAMLAAALLWPRFAFPLAWLFLWPLCEAGLRLLPKAPGLPSPLGNGAFARHLLLIAAPMALLWEGLNWGCPRGWVYTVPFFEHPKLFEMPLAGYLGYFPFFLECGAALALLDRLRPLLQGRRGLLAVAAVLALHVAIDRLCAPTSISTTPRLSQASAFREDAARLAAQGIRTPRALLESHAPAPARLRNLAELAEVTHMGVPRAGRYEALTGSVAGLAAADAAALAAQTGDDPALVRLFVDKARAAASR